MICVNERRNAVYLRLGEQCLAQSKDPAVFVVSPRSAWANRLKKKSERRSLFRSHTLPGCLPRSSRGEIGSLHDQYTEVYATNQVDKDLSSVQRDGSAAVKLRSVRSDGEDANDPGHSAGVLETECGEDSDNDGFRLTTSEDFDTEALPTAQVATALTEACAVDSENLDVKEHVSSDDADSESSSIGSSSSSSSISPQPCSDEGVRPVNDAEALFTGVMSRASEQLMVMNVKSLAARQKLRFDTHGPATSTQRRRLETQDEARKFTEIYNSTVDVLKSHMTLVAPRAGRQSIMDLSLREYDSSSPSPSSSPKIRSCADGRRVSADVPEESARKVRDA